MESCLDAATALVATERPHRQRSLLTLFAAPCWHCFLPVGISRDLTSCTARTYGSRYRVPLSLVISLVHL